MIFNSLTFLLFLIIVVLLSWVLPRTPRLWMLFIASIIFYGFVAGLLADALLYGLMMYGNSQIENLNELQNETDLIILFGALLVLGVLVGHFSTFRAIKKYLKLSLDELY